MSEQISSRRMVRVSLAGVHRLVCPVVLVFAMAGVSREGRARTVVLATQLDYLAAPGCPSAARFAAVVTGRLGYDAFSSDAQDRVVVRIEATGRTLEGRLEWHDAGGAVIGEQTFPSRTGDCDELTRAMGFALALQIQLMAATVGENRPPPVTPAPVPPRAPPPA
ncbi:MAG TPA: hypothetical protein VHO06_20925, partial [Polyangia bacterium]|nr:hypothetical protein [Polyangia bacterium]